MSWAWPITLSWAINLLTIAVCVANVLLVVRWRRTAYSSGWIDGRLSLLLSMHEAQQRGLSVKEWVEAEAQRDADNHLPELVDALRRLGVELSDKPADES